MIGPVVVITTWLGLPAWSGKARLRICWTGCAPPVRLLVKALPAAWAPKLKPTKAISQMISTRQRWSWHHPAIRARPLSVAGREGNGGTGEVFGRVEMAMGRKLIPCRRRGNRSGCRPHRYSFLRIHTSTNHPQIGGR